MADWKGTIFLDIEVYGDLFLVSWKKMDTGEYEIYEVSERKDDRERLYSRLKTFKGFMVTFNGLHYDEVVLTCFLKEFSFLKRIDLDHFCQYMQDTSNEVIHGDGEKTKQYKYAVKGWKSIDVFTLGWSKGLRVAKQVSLKSLAIQLNHPEIQELPFDINHLFKDNDEEIEALIHYNTVNDIGVLEKIFNALKGEIGLRGYIKQTYGLECWSLDAPRIASEYLLDVFCKRTFSSEYCIDDNEKCFNNYKRDVRNSAYVPKPFLLKDYLPRVEFKTRQFKDLYERFQNCSGSFSEEFVLNKNDTSVKLLPSIGGIHSENNNQFFESDDEWVIIDADIASLYPTLFKEYKFLRGDLKIVLDKYVEIIDDRIKAKRSGDKTKDKFFKLILNSFSGLADSPYSWLYSPEQLLALRVTGQLIQLRFIEELTELQGVKVVFSNTDGTLCLIKRENLSKYCEIAKSIEKEFNVTWEFTLNKKIIFSNTNTYLSVIDEEFMLDDDLNLINHKRDVNKIKRKGALFRYGSDIPLGDSVNMQVVAKALEKYFIEGITPEDFILNWKENGLSIFDFCCSKKVNKKFAVFHGDKIVQNINRYYFSKKGMYLTKVDKTEMGATKQHLHKDSPVQLLNSYYGGGDLRTKKS